MVDQVLTVELQLGLHNPVKNNKNKSRNLSKNIILFKASSNFCVGSVSRKWHFFYIARIDHCFSKYQIVTSMKHTCNHK